MNTKSMDATTRFTHRVADYAKYRPTYPAESIDWIFKNVPLKPDSRIADVGSGTGLFTEALLARTCSVVAVEPNDAMRSESDKHLSMFENYSSISGTAENTGLSDGSLDLITAAQAFHWFDLAKTKVEFDRVLSSTGKVLLIWNRRNSDGSAFLSHYESLLSSRIPEYKKVSHVSASDSVIEKFLGPQMSTAEFEHHQLFDLESLKGRLQSSSYCPAEGSMEHKVLIDDLESLYDDYSDQKGIRFDYRTQVYLS